MNKLESILVTGFFRTGSTLLFSALRQCVDLRVYYEPYHPDIVEYVDSCQKGLPNADRERLGHTVDGDYFEEYRKLNLDEMAAAFNKEDRTVHHPVLNSLSTKLDLFNYVRYLHECAYKEGKVPVLQANRLNFCFDWFSKHFPSNYNVLITRKPSDIFSSLRKLALKDGIDLRVDTVGLDYWNVLSIFDSLKARYSKIIELEKSYYYKLCFVVEWINRIESSKANLVVPYELLGNGNTQKAISHALKVFSNNVLPVSKYIEEHYVEVAPKSKSEYITSIERLVDKQLSFLKNAYEGEI
ncbi:sulfotransferase [Alteromonas sp. OM2203]|uniref:sulfotransferase n=1 Tax=Alteromonas sp. OM2203 TaxID=3398817 RepID=UPI003AF352D3